MRRFLVLVSVACVALIGLLAIGPRPGADAQDATPAIDEGITVESLASGAVPAYPPLPGEIALYRLRIAPGGQAVTPAGDTGLALVYVESGTLVIQRTVAGVVMRGAVMGTPGALTQEPLSANTDVTLRAGDSYLAAPHSGGVLRNDGDEEAIILDVVLASVEDATPTP